MAEAAGPSSLDLLDSPAQVVEALHAGRPEVIEEILLSCSPRIRKWLYRRLGPDAALDDVTQEALTELARALPSFEGRSSVTTFAYRITARAAARHLRRKRTQREHLGEPNRYEESLDAWSTGRDPERAAIEHQALRAVLGCLERLPARRREAFILCALEGETPKDAARLLGTSENAVRSRLMHARRELERRLRGRDLESILRGPP
jgi:RNA polymerase sigma-70 factor (ECF subfamily)